MNTPAPAQYTLKRTIVINLAFWAVAILAPVVVRLLPTASGAPPKIFELLVPLFQIALALGTTHLIRTAMAGRPDSQA